MVFSLNFVLRGDKLCKESFNFETLWEAAMLFTDAQMRQYDEEGAVTIDSPFTTEELDRGRSGMGFG